MCQPFACLPNHVTGKGMIKVLHSRYKVSNITPNDYDHGASEVNQLNRIKLMISSAKFNLEKTDNLTEAEKMESEEVKLENLHKLLGVHK